jgi:cyclopropane fatty-acyl-phospholipid synthase-like methyltransferase
MRQILRDDAQNALLSRRGYVRERFLTETQINELLANARLFYPEDKLSPSQDQSGKSFILNSYTDPNTAYRESGAKYLKSILYPYIEQLFHGYRIISCGLFIKVPGAGWLDLHYHPTVVDNPKHWVIDIWCPLINADLENGTLCVVPESHKIFPQTIGHPSSGPLFCKDYTDVIREQYSLALPSQAGDAVIFDNSLLHWSPVNRSPGARYALHCSCVPIEATTVHTHYDSNQGFKFDLYKATDDYFDQVFGSLLPRPSHLDFLKTIPNLNRLYSLDEFQERLRNAAQIRHNLLPESQYVHDEHYHQLLVHESATADFPQSVSVPREFTIGPVSQSLNINIPPAQSQTLQPITTVRSSVLPTLYSWVTRLSQRFGSVIESATAVTRKTEKVQRKAHQAINLYSTSDVQQYYDEMTSSYIAGFGEVFQGSRPESTDELVDYLIQAARLEDNLTILDAGCGICGPAIMFAERCKLTIEAVTLSSVQVNEAQARIVSKGLQEQIRVRQGDFHRLGELYPANTFDRVLFLESLCHAEDYRKVLSQAKQVLKPGGFLYIKDFYAIDYRSRPELLPLQVKDLKSLNQLYRLVMPDLTSTVDLISELGFEIFFMRKPLYHYSLSAWQNFMQHTNQFWIRESGPAIQTAEFLALKPVT